MSQPSNKYKNILEQSNNNHDQSHFNLKDEEKLKNDEKIRNFVGISVSILSNYIDYRENQRTERSLDMI